MNVSACGLFSGILFFRTLIFFPVLFQERLPTMFGMFADHELAILVR